MSRQREISPDAGNRAAAARLTAYVMGPGAHVEPAARWRDWMNATDARFANRCLPLLMANQAGWSISLEHPVRASWTGGRRPDDVVVQCESYLAPKGHFGHGILTWHVPFLFRTDPGWNVLARGPANLPKDGIAPLEGLVESDWSAATFTMNWRFTRPCEVAWAAGEPFAMIVPQRRGDLEAIKPNFAPLVGSPEVESRHAEWCESRAQFLTDLRSGDGAASTRRWERHYFCGRTPGGESCAEHQTVIRLAPFEEPEGPRCQRNGNDAASRRPAPGGEGN